MPFGIDDKVLYPLLPVASKLRKPHHKSRDYIMALCLIQLLMFLLKLKMTIELTQEIPRTSDYLVECTTKLIENLQNHMDTVRIYSDISLTGVSLVKVAIEKRLFQLDQPIPIILSEKNGKSFELINNEEISLAFASEIGELESTMAFFYHRFPQRANIVCITHTRTDILEKLYELASKIWIKGIPRNTFFVISGLNHEEAWVIGIPGYSRNNCAHVQFIRVGWYSKTEFHKVTSSFYPQIDELGGCELSVMVQPPFLPYVKRKNDRYPGGFVGDIIDMLAVSMNFTPKYVWSWTHNLMMDHLNGSDLNLVIDMLPRTSISGTKYRFSFGMTKISWIISKSGHGSVWMKLLIPFHQTVWIAIVIVLLGVMITSRIAQDRDSGNILLKLFGSLLGIGVGRMTNIRWFRLFLWFWLFSAYILTQIYLAFLTKAFTVPPKITQIDTVSELAESDAEILCSPNGYRAIHKMEEQIAKLLAAKCNVVTDDFFWNVFFQRFLETGKLNNSAIVANMEYVDGNPAFLNVHMIESGLFSVHQLAHAKPGSAWIFRMNKLFGRFFSTGIVQHLRHQHSIKKRRHETNTDDKFIHLDIMKSAFMLHVIGLIISTIFFVAELIIFHYIERGNG